MDEILSSGFAELGIAVDSDALPRFRRFYEYLTERNAVMDLTAIKGEEETARLHFLDCCALLRAYHFAGRSVADVGSGAGFPGLPLLIAEPSIRLTMLDAQLKRVEFQRESCALLDLKALSLQCRAEEAPGELRESFDVAVSRAVARLNALCELALPLVKPGGVFIAMKGPEYKEELREAESAIRELGGEYESAAVYTIPGTEISHSAVVIRKASPTPEKYPRRWAKISKKPL